MGLPSRKDIELTRHRQHVFGHAGAEALDVPLLRAVEAELPIEAVVHDLGRHLQEDHPGEAAAVGVGGVVVAGALHVEPHIDHLQPVAAGRPGAAALGRLLIDHMADPALASGDQHRGTQLGHRRILGPQLPLQRQLAGQFGGGIGGGAGVGQHLLSQLLQRLEQARLQGSLQQIARKQAEHLHAGGGIGVIRLGHARWSGRWRPLQPFTASPLALGRMYRCKPMNKASTGRIDTTAPAATRRQSSEKLLASCCKPRGRV